LYSSAHHCIGSHRGIGPTNLAGGHLGTRRQAGRLKLRSLANAELFKLYDSELVLHLHNTKNLTDTRKILARLQLHLAEYPPSPELAKGFLSEYADREPRTLYRYSQMVIAFMKWCGEPLEELKFKVPKSIPQYTDKATVNTVRAAISRKKDP
jgi:hypothetical protein